MSKIYVGAIIWLHLLAVSFNLSFYTKGKTSTMALKKILNKANVSSITYSSGNKPVATVSKTGKITTKKKGTVTIKTTAYSLSSRVH